MSRLRELMEEFCPGGVEYKKLGDVVSVCRGVRVVRAELQLVGKYPVYQNSLIPMGYYDKENCIAGTAFIIGAGAAGDIGYSDVPFWAADDCFYFVCEDNMNARFLYYVLVGQETFIKGKVRKASIPRLSRNVVEKMVIPVPPLEIQNEIVKLLDNFTKLTAELTLRKKQYNFYRDSLLNFVRVDNTIVQIDRQTDRQAQRISKFGLLRKEFRVEWKTLGEVANVVRGASPRPIQKFVSKETGSLPWVKIRDAVIGAKYISQTSEKITLEGAKKSRKVVSGDLILSNSMSFGRPYLMKIEGYIHDGWLAITEFDKVYQSDFLYHLLSSGQIQDEMRRKASFGGAVQNLNSSIVKELHLPVPPLEVQQKIVSILDRFDALCNDLTSGLLAEIAARKRQYEHYRDKLLTFPRING